LAKTGCASGSDKLTMIGAGAVKRAAVTSIYYEVR